MPEFSDLKNKMINGSAVSIYKNQWYGIKEIEGFPWYIVAKGNDKELKNNIYKLTFYLFLVILLSIGLEVILVTVITIPITDTLNEAIHHINNMALGNFDTKENDSKKHNNNIANALSSSIYDMQKNISSVIYNLKLNIDSINAEMEKISLGNNDLSDKTIDQASSINELASAIEFLSSSIADTYNNTNNAAESWLISPAVNFKKAVAPEIVFDEAHRYLNGANPDSYFAVKVSTDYKGDVTTCNWTNLTVTGWSDGTTWDFVTVNPMDLSSFIGQTVYIAFQYRSDETAAPTWEIMNLKVRERESESAE